MSSIWSQVVIFIRLYWIWIQVSADGEILDSNVKLTWKESRKYCEDNGKVLFDAKKNDYEASLRKILKDTNQAWVSARVEYSHVVKMPVCVATSKQFGPKKSFDTDIIGNCLKFCNGHLYAGLKDTDCYCFNDSSSLPRSMGCNYTCNNDPFHQCGGNESISLYEKADKTITKHIVNGCKECVYARTIRGDFKLFTESCVGHGTHSAICQAADKTITKHIVNGCKECVYARTIRGDFKLFTESCVGHGTHSAICQAGRDAACLKNGWSARSGQLCRINPVGFLRWKQAKQYCADIGGHLISSEIPELELVTNDTCCAVARREGDLVLIEGDDCFATHAIICQDESLEKSSASPQSTDIPFPGCDSECTDTNITYGMVAVSVMLLVALVITALVCDFRRRQVLQESVKESTTRSTREQNLLLERQITNPPSQPSRHIHTENENRDSSYLTVIFDRGRQDVAMEQPGCSHFD